MVDKKQESALAKFTGLAKNVWRNLVTFNETHLAAMSNEKVMDNVKALFGHSLGFD